MKSADAQLSVWFSKKKGAASTALDVSALAAEISSVRLSLNRADLDRAFGATLELLSMPPSERSPERCVDLMLGWAACRSPKTALSVGALLIERLALVSPEHAFPALTDVALVEPWRKAVGVPAPDLVTLVLSRAEHTFPLPVFDWALLNSPEPASRPLRYLLDQLANPTAAKLAVGRVTAFVAKDAKAQHFAALLGLLAEEPQRVPAIATVIQGSSEAMVAALDNLPKLAGLKNEHLPLAGFIEALFAPMLDTTLRKRTRACALLARLGGNLLLVEKRGRGGDEALASVAALGHQFRSSARDPENAAATWFLTSAAQPAPSTGELLSSEGALRWAFAYEECQQSGTPLGPLESLGRNLGLRPIAEPGTVVKFEPRWHQDPNGGLLPDAPGRVRSGGWQYQGRPIIRAVVDPA